MIKSRLQGPAIRCYFSSIYGEQAGSLPLARRGIFPALWRNARSLVTTERAPPNYTKFFSASSASPRETLPISSYIPRPRRSVPLHHCSCFPLILSTLWLQPAYSPSHAPHPSQACPGFARCATTPVQFLTDPLHPLSTTPCSGGVEGLTRVFAAG